jgi:hypothetical protein
LAGHDIVSNDYQSDRSYPPFISAANGFDIWYAVGDEVERASGDFEIAGNRGAQLVTLSTP